MSDSGQGAAKGGIGIVILAAGESARMGEPKQLLPFRGTTLLRRTVETALAVSCGPVAVVLGAFAEKIRPTLDNLSVLVLENPGWREGMGTSLRAGLGALLSAQPAISAVIVLLSDQPLLSGTTLGTLVVTHELTGREIVASEYGGTLGVPALFAREFFPELLALDGAAGARQIIATHRARAISVPFADGAVDIDTPADYARLRSCPTS